jgi:hypothetical protein|tara:strand:+ start:780 stop:923 length:144 start_codon:yes stop_codon:yes gene_type:complete
MRITPIQRTVFSQRKQSQTWKIKKAKKSDKNANKPLTLPESSVIIIK